MQPSCQFIEILRHLDRDVEMIIGDDDPHDPTSIIETAETANRICMGRRSAICDRMRSFTDRKNDFRRDFTKRSW